LAQLELRVEGEVDKASTIEGPVVIERGARVLGSRIIGPVVIGEEAVVERSAVGPNVAVGRRAEVRGAEVTDSILMDGARVEDVTVQESVIGREAAVRGDPSCAALFLGDQGWATIRSAERASP